MAETTDRRAATLADASGSRDPEVGLRAVAALRGLLEVLEALQVDNARAKGLVVAGHRRPTGGQQAGRPPEARPP